MYKYVITIDKVFEIVFNDEIKAFEQYNKLTNEYKHELVMMDKISDIAFEQYIKDYDFNFLRDNSIIG